MELVKKIVDDEEYVTMKQEDMLDIACKEFSKFDDDKLKILYLTKCFEKSDKSQLSMSPEKCATLLVESGTFER